MVPHTVRIGISDEIYSVLSKTNIVHWFCKRCNSGVMKTVKCVGQLMDKVGVLEEKLVAVETETHNEIKREHPRDR